MNKLKWIVFALLTIVLTILFNSILSHVVYWQENNQLFLFGNIYLEQQLSSPAGLLKYITAFCVQFFYYPALGGTIMAVLIALVYLFNTIILKKISGKADKFLLSLLPALFLLFQYCRVSYPLTVLTGILLSQLGFLLFMLLPKSAKKYLSYIFLVILFYISGTSSILFLIYYVIYELSQKKYYRIFPLTAVFVALFFVSAYYYRISVDTAIMSGLHFKTDYITLLALFIPSFISVFYLSGFYPVKKKNAIILTLLLIIAYGGAGLWGVKKMQRPNVRLMLIVNKYTNEERWDKVLEFTSRYPGKNQIANYLQNLALYYAGRLSDEMFHYPQNYGVNSLYPAWTKETRMAEYGDLLFAGLGYYNEATRWAFESMTIAGETAPILKKLIKYNIYNNKPQIAQKFINVLNQSLFHSKEVAGLERLIGQPAPVRPVVHDTTHPALFAGVVNITRDLLYLCDKDPGNHMAFEYMMANFLLGNRIVDFANNLWRISKLGYKRMPNSYEEALIIFRMLYPDRFKALGIGISDYTLQRFAQYEQLFRAHNKNELQRLFGNTYWYYLHHISPYGVQVLTEEPLN